MLLVLVAANAVVATLLLAEAAIERQCSLLSRKLLLDEDVAVADPVAKRKAVETGAEGGDVDSMWQSRT